MTDSQRQRWSPADVAAWILVVVGVVFRFLALGYTPGFNGDEAWYGVQVLRPFRDIEWRTPNDNILNPFLALPDYLLGLIFAPSVTLIRSPAALAGTACIGAIWFFWHSFLPRSTARSAAVLVATLPIVIAYSRTGWDPCEIVFAGVAVLWASLTGRPVLTIVAMTVAVWIHPTNVFLLPIVLIHGVTRIWGEGRDRARRMALLGTVAAGFFGIANLAFLSSRHANKASESLDVSGWLRYGRFVAELLSGASSYRYFAGPIRSWVDSVHIWAFAVLFVPALIVGTMRLARREMSHVAGWAVSVLAFGFLAAHRAMEADGDIRYGLVLVAPTVLVWLMCVDAIRIRELAHNVAVPLIGFVCLATFAHQYFRRIWSTGGQAHEAFRTATIEPKQAVVDLIRARPCPMKIVSGEDWWTAEPLKYLLAKDANTIVYKAGDVPATAMNGVPTECVFAVSFRGGTMERAMKSSGMVPTIVRDAANRPLIELWTANRTR